MSDEELGHIKWKNEEGKEGLTREFSVDIDEPERYCEL